MKVRLVLTTAALSILIFYSVGLSLAACPQDMTNYWSLNETAPPYLDSVGGKNATCTNCPSPITGIVGGAQSFSVVGGVGKDVSAPATDLNWATGDSFTIELWANTTSCTSQTEVMIGRAGTECNLQWWVGCNKDGKFKFRLEDSSGNGPATITSSKSYNDGQWHYLVAIHDAVKGELRFYVDKELQLIEPATYASDFSAACNLSIGHLPLGGSNYYFGGALDEIAITKRAISDSEIIDHWNNGAGKSYCEAVNNPPTKPELVSPADGSQTDNTVTFTWKNSTDPDGDPIKYKLNYCTDANFTGCEPIEVAVAGSTSYYAGIGGLGAGVLMIGLSFFGISSRRRRVALLLLGVLIISAGFLVSCGGGGGGSSTPPSVNETYTATGLTNGTGYFWKVSAEDGKGGATESDVWSFTVK